MSSEPREPRLGVCWGGTHAGPQHPCDQGALCWEWVGEGLGHGAGSRTSLGPAASPALVRHPEGSGPPCGRLMPPSGRKSSGWPQWAQACR